jgi:hypothetical protein
MVSNSKNSPGRPVTLIRGSFLESEPNDAQVLLILEKNSKGGKAWQTIADELAEVEGVQFSGAYIYRVAKGEIRPSAAIKRALGLEKPYPSYFKCRQDDIEQVAKQLGKYWPGEFIRKGE